MIGRVVCLDEIAGRPAAALMVDGVLQDLAIDPADDVAIPGAIYRAVADRPVKGQGGIFEFQVQACRIGNLGPVNEGGKQAFNGAFHGFSLISLPPADKGWRSWQSGFRKPNRER